MVEYTQIRYTKVKVIHSFSAIIDANLNRACEGLRVLEDYARFIATNRDVAHRLAALRHAINQHTPSNTEQLARRDTPADVRAKEAPQQRINLTDLLIANFKRITEALRVLEEYTGDPFYNTCRYDVYDLEQILVLRHLKKALRLPGIYLISHDKNILLEGLKWGVSLIQLRPRHDDLKPDILADAQLLSSACQNSKTAFIVNDHLDIALATNADGFHSGQDGLPLPTLRKLIGPHKLLGRTTHTLEQGLMAADNDADYVSVGPIWETPSKPGRPAIGFNYLEQAHQLPIPYVAIGGINADRFDTITEFNPPLIGLVRDYQQIPSFISKLEQKNAQKLLH